MNKFYEKELYKDFPFTYYLFGVSEDNKKVFKLLKNFNKLKDMISSNQPDEFLELFQNQ